jgi:adenylate cyclase
VTEQGKASQHGKGRGKKRVVLWVWSLVVGLLAVGAAWGLEHNLVRAQLYLLLNWQGMAYDLGMTRHARQALRRGYTAPVVVAAITEGTNDVLDRVDVPAPDGGKPQRLRFRYDRRFFHARVLENLRKLGARVVVFDILFDEEDENWDGQLARAIRDHGKVILAAVDDPRPEEGILHSLQYPTPALRTAAAGLGVVNVPLDPDETLRRFYWWFPGFDEDTAEDVPIPSLGVAAAALYSGADPRRVIQDEVQARRTFLGGPIVWMPSGDSPTSFITFAGTAGYPAGLESVVNYDNLLDIPARDAVTGVARLGMNLPASEELRDRVRDRIVIIGDSTRIAQDLHRVAVVSRIGEKGEATQQMPGVEAQAHITQTAMFGRYVRRASEAAHIFLLLATCLMMALVGRVLSPVPAFAAGLTLLAALWFGSNRLLAEDRIWLEPVTASVGLAMALVGETVVMFFGERRERMQVRRQLARQVGPGIADKLTEDEWPELAGESCEITMLFSDLQGFTSLSENLSSPEICALLNQYFGIIFPVLDQHGGTLDKLMGDGMMAYFGWPQRHPDHAARAVRCAIEMQKALEAWQNLPEKKGLPPLRTRIGVHTGIATVGGIGSGEREEFTVIGDVVNVASRLEGMNKDYQTTILISEDTRQAAGEIAPMVFRGTATVRGRKEQINVYSVEVE